MATKKVNESKATAWTKHVEIDFNSSISGCALEMFGCIDDAAVREKILKLMQACHEKLLEYENGQTKN